jgi:transposase-like protein
VRKTPFERLLIYFAEDSEAEIARRFGISPQAFNKWKQKGIPDGRALDVERETNGRVRAREVLAYRALRMPAIASSRGAARAHA